VRGEGNEREVSQQGGRYKLTFFFFLRELEATWSDLKQLRIAIILMVWEVIQSNTSKIQRV